MGNSDSALQQHQHHQHQQQQQQEEGEKEENGSHTSSSSSKVEGKKEKMNPENCPAPATRKSTRSRRSLRNRDYDDDDEDDEDAVGKVGEEDEDSFRKSEKGEKRVASSSTTGSKPTRRRNKSRPLSKIKNEEEEEEPKQNLEQANQNTPMKHSASQEEEEENQNGTKNHSKEQEEDDEEIEESAPAQSLPSMSDFFGNEEENEENGSLANGHTNRLEFNTKTGSSIKHGQHEEDEEDQNYEMVEDSQMTTTDHKLKQLSDSGALTQIVGSQSILSQELDAPADSVADHHPDLPDARQNESMHQEEEEMVEDSQMSTVSAGGLLLKVMSDCGELSNVAGSQSVLTQELAPPDATPGYAAGGRSGRPTTEPADDADDTVNSGQFDDALPEDSQSALNVVGDHSLLSQELSSPPRAMHIGKDDDGGEEKKHEIETQPTDDRNGLGAKSQPTKTTALVGSSFPPHNRKSSLPRPLPAIIDIPDGNKLKALSEIIDSQTDFITIRDSPSGPRKVDRERPGGHGADDTAEDSQMIAASDDGRLKLLSESGALTQVVGSQSLLSQELMQLSQPLTPPSSCVKSATAVVEENTSPSFGMRSGASGRCNDGMTSSIKLEEEMDREAADADGVCCDDGATANSQESLLKGLSQEHQPLLMSQEEEPEHDNVNLADASSTPLESPERGHGTWKSQQSPPHKVKEEPGASFSAGHGFRISDDYDRIGDSQRSDHPSQLSMTLQLSQLSAVSACDLIIDAAQAIEEREVQEKATGRSDPFTTNSLVPKEINAAPSDELHCRPPALPTKTKKSGAWVDARNKKRRQLPKSTNSDDDNFGEWHSSEMEDSGSAKKTKSKKPKSKWGVLNGDASSNEQSAPPEPSGRKSPPPEPSGRKSPPPKTTRGLSPTRSNSPTRGRTKTQKAAELAEANSIAQRAALMASQTIESPEVAKQLLLSMALSRENPRSQPSTLPPPGSMIKHGFFWGQFTPLETVLRSHMEEYYELSTTKCQSRDQQDFNNRLVALVRAEADSHGWVFDKSAFDDRKIRDRIRCFFKTHIQNAKKRLKTMVRNPTKKANARALAAHLDLIEKYNKTNGTAEAGTAEAEPQNGDSASADDGNESSPTKSSRKRRREGGGGGGSAKKKGSTDTPPDRACQRVKQEEEAFC